MRILLVEDERDAARMVAKGLREQAYAVDVVADGEAACDQAAINDYDAIVLDVLLPLKDGLAVCRQLRREGASVPILMLTARDSELDKVLGLELGADDYVTKPFSLRELQARIRALLRRSETQANAPAVTAKTVDLGNVRVDLAGHQLLRDGEALPVKPKAFELLVFLIRNAGQVFTREQLLERVWGYDYAGETRTVDVHVHLLRQRVEEDAANPRYIQTVRGVGYVFRGKDAATAS
jgi:DNA-binding response OmpR family regulator